MEGEVIDTIQQLPSSRHYKLIMYCLSLIYHLIFVGSTKNSDVLLFFVPFVDFRYDGVYIFDWFIDESVHQ